MITNTINKSSLVMWQEPKSDDTPIGEPALLITKYGDVLCIRQGDSEIIITLECVPEFIKAVQRVMKMKE